MFGAVSMATVLQVPIFYQGTLNEQRYASFLQDTLPLLMEDVGLETLVSMWFQHDGCPAHFARVARDVMDEKFPNRWIGRGGPVRWPARSLDLTPLDYFLWSALQDSLSGSPNYNSEYATAYYFGVCGNICGNTGISTTLCCSPSTEVH